MLNKRYANRKGVCARLIILQFILLPLSVLAEVAGNMNCPLAEVVSANGLRIEFGQHRFPDESSDLALRVHTEDGMDIKRVTYGGAKTAGCHYKSVVLVPGGSEDQWGWHLAWASDQGLFYARMDGQAWVSSPPKRLSKASTSGVELIANGQELRLKWNEQHGDWAEVYQAMSFDEGRSWEAPAQVQPAN